MTASPSPAEPRRSSQPDSASSPEPCEYRYLKGAVQSDTPPSPRSELTLELVQEQASREKMRHRVAAAMTIGYEHGLQFDEASRLALRAHFRESVRSGRQSLEFDEFFAAIRQVAEVHERRVSQKIQNTGRVSNRRRCPVAGNAVQVGRERRPSAGRTSGSRRTSSSSSSSSSSDDLSGDSEPPSRWQVSARLQGLSSFATFADLHELTPALSGPERLVVFESLSPDLQTAIYANLGTSLGGEWS